MSDERIPATEELANAALQGRRQVVGLIHPGAVLKVAPSDVSVEAAASLNRALLPGERRVLNLLSIGVTEQWGSKPGDLKRLNFEGLKSWYETRVGRR